MSFVVDASITLAWYLAGEATPYSEAVRDRLDDYEGVAPAIWPLEVTNALLVGERRRRVSHTQAEEILRLLRLLPITIEDSNLDRVTHTVLSIARRHQLTIYDASYLELAIRHEIPLATLDQRLQAATTHAGGQLVEVSI